MAKISQPRGAECFRVGNNTLGRDHEKGRGGAPLEEGRLNTGGLGGISSAAFVFFGGGACGGRIGANKMWFLLLFLLPREH